MSALRSEVAFVELPVSVAAGGVVAARVFPPEPAAAAELPRPIWVALLGGATEDWHYWDMQAPEGVDGSYSFVEFLASRGIGALAMDTFGTGDSRYFGHGSDLTTDVLSLAHHQAVSQLRDMLRTGTLVADVASVDPLYVGVGHSGGAGLTLTMQGQHESYDAVAALGFPAGEFGGYEGGSGEVWSRLVARGDGLFTFSTAKSSLSKEDPSLHPDTPILLLEHNASFRQAVPPGLPALMTPNQLAQSTSRIQCPVLLVFGEIDLAVDPLAERDFYPRAADLTIHIQPGTRHSHQTGPRRHELAATIYAWLWGRSKYYRAAV